MSNVLSGFSCSLARYIRERMNIRLFLLLWFAASAATATLWLAAFHITGPLARLVFIVSCFLGALLRVQGLLGHLSFLALSTTAPALGLPTGVVAIFCGVAATASVGLLALFRPLIVGATFVLRANLLAATASGAIAVAVSLGLLALALPRL
jgi:hypothetical protein